MKTIKGYAARVFGVRLAGKRYQYDDFRQLGESQNSWKDMFLSLVKNRY